jgi:5-methylcytosine-specific restriction endonuclease McrA
MEEQKIKRIIDPKIPCEFDALVNKHRKLIQDLHSFFDIHKIREAEITGDILALVRANFKCEKPGCDSDEDLTFHHLIQRKTKAYLPEYIYYPQRHFFANRVVLCKNHHAEADGGNAETMEPTGSKKIERIRRKVNGYLLQRDDKGRTSKTTGAVKNSKPSKEV